MDKKFNYCNAGNDNLSCFLYFLVYLKKKKKYYIDVRSISIGFNINYCNAGNDNLSCFLYILVYFLKIILLY